MEFTEAHTVTFPALEAIRAGDFAGRFRARLTCTAGVTELMGGPSRRAFASG